MPSTTGPQAWGGLEELRPLLSKRMRASCRDEHELDDLIQETFLRAARYRASLSDPEKLSGWLLRIARNVQRDQIRRELRLGASRSAEDLIDSLQSREPAPGDGACEVELEIDRRPVERGVALGHLAPALDSLRACDRVLLESYYHRGEGARAAAQRIEVEHRAVKVRLFRARQRLRKALGRSLARERVATLIASEVRA